MAAELQYDEVELNRPPISGPAYVYDKCHWCQHSWHGLVCASCLCESATHRPDDTWRPALSSSEVDQARRIMRDTGCDGWTAMRCVGPTSPGLGSPHIVRSKLYGHGRR